MMTFVNHRRQSSTEDSVSGLRSSKALHLTMRLSRVQIQSSTEDSVSGPQSSKALHLTMRRPRGEKKMNSLKTNNRLASSKARLSHLNVSQEGANALHLTKFIQSPLSTRQPRYAGPKTLLVLALACGQSCMGQRVLNRLVQAEQSSQQQMITCRRRLVGAVFAMAGSRARANANILTAVPGGRIAKAVKDMRTKQKGNSGPLEKQIWHTVHELVDARKGIWKEYNGSDMKQIRKELMAQEEEFRFEKKWNDKYCKYFKLIKGESRAPKVKYGRRKIHWENILEKVKKQFAEDIAAADTQGGQWQPRIDAIMSFQLDSDKKWKTLGEIYTKGFTDLKENLRLAKKQKKESSRVTDMDEHFEQSDSESLAERTLYDMLKSATLEERAEKALARNEAKKAALQKKAEAALARNEATKPALQRKAEAALRRNQLKPPSVKPSSDHIDSGDRLDEDIAQALVESADSAKPGME